MKYSVTISIPGGHLSLEMDSQKQVFDELSFWQSLPEYCPIDGSKVRLNSRDARTAKNIAVVYYELVSTGEFPYRGYIGQNVEGGTLFHDGTWRFYDGQAETVVWRDGRMVADLNKLHGRKNQDSGNSSQPTQHRKSEPAHVQAPSIQQPPPEIDDCAPGEKNPFTDPLAGATVPAKRLANKINLLFKGDAQRAGQWLILRYTRRSTPDNVRGDISALTGEECETIGAALNDKPDSFKAAFAADVAAQGQASGK